MTTARVLIAAAAVATGLTLGGCPAQAQEGPLGFVSRAFQFGDPPPPINYSERAPLVIPPKRNLNAPAASVAEQDPAWPKDPDEAKRRKAGGVLGLPTGNGRNPNILMSDDEIAAGTAPSGSAIVNDRGETIDQQNRRLQNPVNPTVLRHKGTFGPQEAPLVAGVEPPRRSLVDPPAGLRVPVASAPLGGDEPLPSEEAAADRPWYKKLFGDKKN